MDQSNRPLVPAPPMPAHAVIDDAFIKSRILTIRGVQVILAPDLALFYGVPTKRLNEQVKRNGDRFPERFMFRLASEEVASLRSQFATSNGGAEFGTTALRSQFATSKRGPRPPILRRHENGRTVHSVHSPKDLRETNSRQPVSSSSRRPRCKRHFLSIRS